MSKFNHACIHDQWHVPSCDNCCSLHTAGIPSLSPKEREDLEFKLECNLEEITKKFADYTHWVHQSFENKNIEVKALQTFLLGVSSFNSKCYDHKLSLLDSKKAKLEKANSICEIFGILKTECCTFLDFHIFEHLLSVFEIEANFEYPQELKKYLEKHRISEFIELKSSLNDISEDKDKLIIVLDIPETGKLIDVTNIKKNIAKILGLNPSALYIYDIKKKCVMVIMLLTKAVAEFIFIGPDIFSQNQKEQFRQLSIQSLECNGYKFNFTHKIGKHNVLCVDVCEIHEQGVEIRLISTLRAQINSWISDLDSFVCNP